MSELNAKQGRAEQLRAEMLKVIAGLSLETLAGLAKYEQDDEAAVPAEDSCGAKLLRDGRDRFVDWVGEVGRFPQSGVDMADAGATWHRSAAVPTQRAQAFMDLGLFFSGHAQVACSADISELDRVLDAVADQLAFTLTAEYGPLV